MVWWEQRTEKNKFTAEISDQVAVLKLKASQKKTTT